MNIFWTKKTFTKILIGLVIFGLNACKTNTVELALEEVTLSKVSFSRNPTNIAWLLDGRLVFTVPQGEYSSRLWIVNSDGSDADLLDLPEELGIECLRTDFALPQALPDGRLALMRIGIACHSDDGIKEQSQILIWNPKDEKSTVDEHFFLHDSRITLFSLAPDLSTGIGSTNAGIEDNLYWLDNTKPNPIDVGMVRASHPEWSPDGESIAFFGSQKLSGPSGPGWATQPDDLWLMPASCQENCKDHLTLLVEDVENSHDLSWGRNNEWLAFTGNPYFRGYGVWLLNIQTRKLVWVVSGDYGRVEWSPLGNLLAVIGYENQGSIDKSSVYLVDITRVIEEDKNR